MMVMERYYGLHLAVLLLIYYSLVSVVIAEHEEEKEIRNLTQEEEIGYLFKQYVIRHNKTYLNDPKEYYKRREIFKVCWNIIYNIVILGNLSFKIDIRY